MDDYYRFEFEFKVDRNDLREWYDFKADCRKLLRDIKSGLISKKISMIVVKERLEELKNLMQDSVSEFYDAYTPHVYDREYRLYDVVQVRTDERKTDFKVVYMAEFLPPYDVAEEYIYDLIFLHGYHGGATSGKTKAGVEHPDGKTPYWKKPVPTFTEWGKKAKKTTSIKYIVNKNERNWRNNELERYIDDAFTRVMSSYDAVKKLGYFVYL